MIIDWYTTIFQIINFMILVFLLRYFLYGPIIRAMDEREQRIVAREQEAEMKKSEADKKAEHYLQKKEQLEMQEDELHQKAKAAAEKDRQELLEQARREVDQTRKRWEEALKREQESFIAELRRRIGRQACAVAGSCLKDLADLEIEEMVRAHFLKKIGELPSQEREMLKEALADEDLTLSLRSAFEVPQEYEEALQLELKEILYGSKELKISTRVDTDLICGIEIEAGGHSVNWSMESYLAGIEEQILKELGDAGPAGNNGEASENG